MPVFFYYRHSFLFSLLFPAFSALAQETGITLSSWNIEVWPEYDKPSVLVIYNGRWPKVVFPADADRFAACWERSTRSPKAMQREISFRLSGARATAKGQAVVFELDKPQFVVEFYVDALSEPPDRSFNLVMSTPYAAQQGELSLRQPSRATDMQITPACRKQARTRLEISCTANNSDRSSRDRKFP